MWRLISLSLSLSLSIFFSLYLSLSYSLTHTNGLGLHRQNNMVDRQSSHPKPSLNPTLRIPKRLYTEHVGSWCYNSPPHLVTLCCQFLEL